MKSFRFALIIISLMLAVSVKGQSAVNTPLHKPAEAYLNAWLYRDYSGMYDVSSSATKARVTRDQFASAASKLEALPSAPKVVTVQERGSGSVLYFESTGSAGATVRGSVILQDDTIEHPELLTKVSSLPESTGVAASDSSLTGITPATQTVGSVDGQSVDSILQHMEQATANIKSMRAKVQVKGSMMGQSINDSGTLLYQSPDKFRMQISSFVMNSDGKTSILYLPQANISMDLAGLGALELTPGFGSSASDIKTKYDVRLAGKTQFGGKPAYILKMKPSQGGITSLTGSGDMKLLVSVETWMPVQAQMQGMQLDYRDVVVNDSSITDQDFVYKTPAGATSLDLGSLMGGLGALPTTP